MLMACRSRTESTLREVLGAERGLVTVEASGAEEVLGWGGSTYAYSLVTHGGLTLLSNASKAPFRDDLFFARANVEDLLERTLTEADAVDLYRKTTETGWSIYVLTGTNKNKVYLLVLTM
jgi:hypothetical protein